MLILQRKRDDAIRIGDDTTITVVHIGGALVQLGIEAPKDVNVVRTELIERGEAQGPRTQNRR